MTFLASQTQNKTAPPINGQDYWLSGSAPVALVNQLIDDCIDLALLEDLGPTRDRDLTSDLLIPSTKDIKATLIFKEAGIVAGANIFARVFAKIDPNVAVQFNIKDGDLIQSVPTQVATVEGPAVSILKAERTALNFLQRLSGIATMTNQFVEVTKPYGIKILDTRKTTPGMRALEKYATQVGGASNHRFGLFDGVMIKDNHITAAGGITNAVSRAKQAYPDKRIEVETKTIAQVEEALKVGVDIIMLDNMPPDMVRKAISTINKQSLIEVSGGMNLTTIRDYLIEGVDAISVGALTHSARNIDISLKVADEPTCA
jgi:nicotinate-nucleotide pyrophosphorylase (carboxylating)